MRRKLLALEGANMQERPKEILFQRSIPKYSVCAAHTNAITCAVSPVRCKFHIHQMLIAKL